MDKPTCLIADCAKPARTRGWCTGHYARWYREGDPVHLRPKVFTIPGPPKTSLTRDEQGNKWCRRCDLWQPESEFGKGRNADGLDTWCKACQRARRQANNVRVRELRRIHHYKMTDEAFKELLASQGHQCAICNTTDPGKRYWHVDHDHACCPGRRSCGECVRGILCTRCNAALGFLSDNIQSAQALVAYLIQNARYDTSPGVEIG